MSGPCRRASHPTGQRTCSSANPFLAGLTTAARETDEARERWLAERIRHPQPLRRIEASSEVCVFMLCAAPAGTLAYVTEPETTYDRKGGVCSRGCCY